MSRITLFGFLQYDPTLFDDIKLPENVDKDILINTIIMESGDLYTYYQHPVYLKANITNWFSRMYEQFKRSMDALTVEYSPIENYDRYEDTTDNRQSNLYANSNSGGSSKSENKTSAFNSDDYQPDSTTSNSNSTNAYQNSNGTEDNKRVSHIHGNVGVTQNVDLINSELGLRKYDLYLEIARQFEKRFLVQVY